MWVVREEEGKWERRAGDTKGCCSCGVCVLVCVCRCVCAVMVVMGEGGCSNFKEEERRAGRERDRRAFYPCHACLWCVLSVCV